MRRVLVTRPEPGASRTATRLRAEGYQPVVLPLTKIESLQPAGWPAAAQLDAVAVASANAVRQAPAGLLRDIGHLPTYTVGERTAAAARDAGLAVADSPAGDAERLLQGIAAGVAPGGRILLLCGRVRRDTLQRGLSRAGFATAVVETYDTLSLSPSSAEVAAALGNVPVDAALFYSAFAAETFARFIEPARTARLFDRASLIVISARVAKGLPAAMRRRVRIAGEATEAAMFSLLATGM